jgi:hypothetical protein
MGIGNLQQVLSDYNGGHPVPYVQLYFDTAPDNHGKAYTLLSSLGDDSSLYYWRVLGAVQIMQLYRTDRAALAHLASLETATGSDADVLHPPALTPTFKTASAITAAYRTGKLTALPADPARYGLTYGRIPPGLRRLQPAAVDVLAVLGTGVRQFSGLRSPLTVAQAVTVGGTGWSFEISRHYHGYGQATAFQAVLDRLQALNLIAWRRTGETIDITVAGSAGQYLVNGP